MYAQRAPQSGVVEAVESASDATFETSAWSGGRAGGVRVPPTSAAAMACFVTGQHPCRFVTKDGRDSCESVWNNGAVGLRGQ